MTSWIRAVLFYTKLSRKLFLRRRDLGEALRKASTVRARAPLQKRLPRLRKQASGPCGRRAATHKVWGVEAGRSSSVIYSSTNLPISLIMFTIKHTQNLQKHYDKDKGHKNGKDRLCQKPGLYSRQALKWSLIVTGQSKEKSYCIKSKDGGDNPQ